ncbi:MAG: glutamine--fructose-6-phosphate transaminase (isomerizing) [Acidobacteriota bacterium]|nr:glutamine--fructose-6-phosphate transaminase (isomerizing) [Acidobacteriota bacterium]
MCGIVGYVGTQSAAPILVEGLRRLEYRGYDSAGIAVCDQSGLMSVRRAEGKLRNLVDLLQHRPASGNYGIAHTRWATHGKPSERNAHPHTDCTGHFVVVHNGIIENYLALREALEAQGHVFSTETDTEVVAHLIEKYYGGSLEAAVRDAVRDIEGVFALSAVSSHEPGKIVTAREGPPVVIGLGEGEQFVASDVPALLPYTRAVMYLEDGDLATITAGGVSVTDFQGHAVERGYDNIRWDPLMAERGGYRHYMLKEIHEQPQAIRQTFAGRLKSAAPYVSLDNVPIAPEQFRNYRAIQIVACGTSWHAALCGRSMLENLARIPVSVDYGSEFRYRQPILSQEVLTVVVSQSGETADTLAAQREAKALGSPTLAICNVFGSMITREAAGTIYTHAGPEIGVASTKAFTGQLAALLVLAAHMGQVRGTLSEERLRALGAACEQLPDQLERVLKACAGLPEIAAKFQHASNALYLGRGMFFPLALEGALKLKEISYIHAEGYPSGEMKHGPNALIDDRMPVVFVTPYDPRDSASCTLRTKTLSNIQEVKARDGKVFAITAEGDRQIQALADDYVEIPICATPLQAILSAIPLQLLAYHVAVLRGCDVDQPRNLAKSVTVE